MPILVVFGEPVTVFSPSVESTLPPSILHPPWGAKTIARSGHYHFHLPHQWVVKNFNTTTILNSTTRTFVHYHQKAEKNAGLFQIKSTPRILKSLNGNNSNSTLFQRKKR